MKVERGSVLNQCCEARRLIELLAEKWTLLVIHTLSSGPMRTADVRRRVEGVSEKMLIQTLRKLERNGIIARRAYPEVPPRVEYRLTKLGTSLATLVCALDGWAEENCERVHQAQVAFDARKEGSGSRRT